jgi:hypothetical protein
VTAGGRGDCKDLAKMDAFRPSSFIGSGIYKITPLNLGDLAKMDAFTVRLDLISPEQG